MVWYGTVQYDTIRYGTARHGAAWHDITWHDMVWYGIMVWYGMTSWFHIISYHITWHDMTRHSCVGEFYELRLNYHGDFIDSKSSVIQVMVWRQTIHMPLSETMMTHWKRIQGMTPWRPLPTTHLMTVIRRFHWRAPGLQWVADVATYNMMTSSNGNIFRVTGHLCGKFTGHRWISHTKASDAELWCFL